MDNFDISIIDSFIDYLKNYSKILIFGYGPSRYCAEYFGFKLRLFLDKPVITTSDEYSANSLIDENTLLIIFSATGTYPSFSKLKNIVKEKNSTLFLIIEEYNPAVISDDYKIMFLTNSVQTFTDIPYKKSRIIFFIFI